MGMTLKELLTKGEGTLSAQEAKALAAQCRMDLDTLYTLLEERGIKIQEEETEPGLDVEGIMAEVENAENNNDDLGIGADEDEDQSEENPADLKAAMDEYGLRRFDGMTLDEFRSSEASADRIVAAAVSQLGVPYVWGGSTPGVGLDCSGLTQYCYAQAGISIPRYSEDQAAAGRRVPLSEAEPGDILWRPGHVAIYVGGDEYIHEPQPGDVCRRATGIAYFTCAVRYR